MSGITVFRKLEQALHAGFHVYERTAEGYLVRQRTENGYAFAVVDLT